MLKTYTKKQLWELYKKLPEEIKDMLFSLDASDNIYNICQKNNLSEEQISKALDYINQVLFGLLPSEEFQETLEKELKIKKDVAKKVAQEINRFIFYPVKPALEQLYKMEISKSAESVEKIKPEREKLEEEKTSLPPKKDVYREIIE